MKSMPSKKLTPLPMVSAGFREMCVITNSDIASNSGQYGGLLEYMMKMIGEFPEERRGLVTLSFFDFLRNGNGRSLKVRHDVQMLLDANAGESPAMIRSAAIAALGCHRRELPDPTAIALAAKHTVRLYKEMADPAARATLSTLLAESESGVFCDREIQELAMDSLMPVIDSGNVHERFLAYRAIERIVAANAGIRNRERFLGLYEKLDGDLKAASDPATELQYHFQSKFIDRLLFAFALLAGDDALARDVVSNRGRELRASSEALVMALRCGNVAMANLLWRGIDKASLRAAFFKHLDGKPQLLDRTLEESLGKFLMAAPDDSSRRFFFAAFFTAPSTFVDESAPSKDTFSRCRMVVERCFPDPERDPAAASFIVGRILASGGHRKIHDSLDDRFCNLLAPRVSQIVAGLPRNPKDRNSNRRENTNDFLTYALHFKNLVDADNPENFARAVTEIGIRPWYIDNKNHLDPVFAATLAVQRRLYNAIDCGDSKEIARCSEFLKPVVVSRARSCRGDEAINGGMLPVALCALCTAFSDRPSDYQTLLRKSGLDPKRSAFAQLGIFFQLGLTNHKGHRFFSKENHAFQMKIFKRILRTTSMGLIHDRNIYLNLLRFKKDGVLSAEALIELYVDAEKFDFHPERVLRAMGRLYSETGDFAMAEQSCLRAAAMANQARNRRLQGEMMAAAAIAMAKQKKFEEAVELAESITPAQKGLLVERMLRGRIESWKTKY